MQTLIAHPATNEQIKALKVVFKALNVPFEVKKEIASEKSEIEANIRQGFKELKLMEEGKLKGTSLKNFINEL